MDPNLTGLADSINGYNYSPNFIQSPDFTSDFSFKNASPDLGFLDLPSYTLEPDPGSSGPSSSSSGESGVDSPDGFSDSVLKYLNQILMEEKLEEKPSVVHDPLALQAAEKSFYEVIGQKYPQSPLQNPESPDENYSTNSSSTSGDNSANPQWVIDYFQNHPLGDFAQSDVKINSQSFVQDMFRDSDSILQFKKGMEEASKFLPTYNPVLIDLDKYSAPAVDPQPLLTVIKEEKESSPSESRGRKHYFEDDYEDERSSKHLAIFVEEEEELSEMFDRVLLCTDSNGKPAKCNEIKDEEEKKPAIQYRQKPVSNGVKNRIKKQGNNNSESVDVDLRTLLASCAQSVACDDRRTATEQLKQIRQNASSSGEASQRLAIIFANGLEARLAGSGTELYAALGAKQLTPVEKLRVYQSYLLACPFKKYAICFSLQNILVLSQEASAIHVVDFGIHYGFQWPMFIQSLADRPNGPPKLRITGIERPQSGFRPAERLEETGRRLASYCNRFNVPFEYNAIATQKWETIKIEDLAIRSGEFLAVNTQFRFDNLLDETIVSDSPRDSVLNLIRKMNPNIFVHSVVNGTHNAPFFVTRFREALFHYSAIFDVFENTLYKDHQTRMMFEQEYHGREVMNVIACEGTARVERPETFKQWNVRHIRAGFKPFPLNRDLMKKLKGKVNATYHKDFVFDEDGHWMLQGWKGRILYASSCWVPSKRSI